MANDIDFSSNTRIWPQKTRYKCTGMEDRMDEALATLRERFEEAKMALDSTEVAGSGMNLYRVEDEAAV